MLTILLADAELELVPPKLTGHQQVQQAAKRVGANASKMLLDSSLHYAALRQAPEGERRGRPDLAHFFLLTVLESIPNRLGLVQVMVHTRHDELIRIAPETRLIRNYNRFCGLIQQLFETGVVGQPEPLLQLEKKRTLESILKELKPDRVVVLHPEGTSKQPVELFSADDEERDIVCIIGGFPSGDYRSTFPPTAEKVSIFPQALTVWTVAAEILAHYPRGAGTIRER
jgi:rRNA small subunit pseudouridine methyltransferase Nep1